MAYDDLSDDERGRLLRWCTAAFEPMKRINSRETSHGISIIFAHAPGGFYVPPGAIKGAMLEAGFRVLSLGALDWRFNISSKDFRKAWDLQVPE